MLKVFSTDILIPVAKFCAASHNTVCTLAYASNVYHHKDTLCSALYATTYSTEQANGKIVPVLNYAMKAYRGVDV
jgi:hypothetical protein